MPSRFGRGRGLIPPRTRISFPRFTAVAAEAEIQAEPKEQEEPQEQEGQKVQEKAFQEEGFQSLQEKEELIQLFVFLQQLLLKGDPRPSPQDGEENKWSAGDKAKDKGGEPQSDLTAPEETEDAEELKMQEALLQSAVDEAWSDKTRVLSFSELPKERRGTPFKECVDNVEADDIESMEERIKAHAKVPAVPGGTAPGRPAQRAQVDPAHRQPFRCKHPGAEPHADHRGPQRCSSAGPRAQPLHHGCPWNELGLRLLHPERIHDKTAGGQRG